MAEGSSTYNVSLAAEAKEVHMPGSGAGAAPVPAASGAWQKTLIKRDLASLQAFLKDCNTEMQI